MKILTVIGARPQFIKASVVSKALMSSVERGYDESVEGKGKLIEL